MFKRPLVVVELPTPAGQKYTDQIQSFGPLPVKNILKKYAPSVEPLRLATLGFSQSCQGPGALLKSNDGGRFDAVLAFDGIHVRGGNAEAPKRQIPSNALLSWIAYARRAAIGEGLCVITNSSVLPPYVSTQQTSDFIWWRAAETTDTVTIPAIPNLETGAQWSTTIGSPPLPAGAKSYTVSYDGVTALMKAPRRANGLVILSWANKDVPAGFADHRFQAGIVLPIVLEKFLVARWNAIDPADPEATCYVG